MGPPGSEHPPRRAHAGVVTRLLAACVDALVVVLLAVAADLAAAGIRFVWSPRDFRWPQISLLATTTALTALAVVYLAVAWAVAGRTYGARLLGLRVLSEGHGLLGWARSGLRALACVVFPAGLLWCAISPGRRSLQDLLVRSVVVYDVHPFVAAAADGSPAVTSA
ncbi:RDD family protein [Trujillonella endophytica]|uniref:RDD family protein n=1 Tax=Trujillonella endophytica TaxID=673521 RepID=A0A1H8QPW1_9ACTN|nr:RDD family protein [Trujillella endophytica]SEO55863.1 RDD family protein [Trujillella endophytica]